MSGGEPPTPGWVRRVLTPMLIVAIWPATVILILHFGGEHKVAIATILGVMGGGVCLFGLLRHARGSGED